MKIAYIGIELTLPFRDFSTAVSDIMPPPPSRSTSAHGLARDSRQAALVSSSNMVYKSYWSFLRSGQRLGYQSPEVIRGRISRFSVIVIFSAKRFSLWTKGARAVWKISNESPFHALYTVHRHI